MTRRRYGVGRKSIVARRYSLRVNQPEVCISKAKELLLTDIGKLAIFKDDKVELVGQSRELGRKLQREIFDNIAMRLLTSAPPSLLSFAIHTYPAAKEERNGRPTLTQHTLLPTARTISSTSLVVVTSTLTDKLDRFRSIVSNSRRAVGLV